MLDRLSKDSELDLEVIYISLGFILGSPQALGSQHQCLLLLLGLLLPLYRELGPHQLLFLEPGLLLLLSQVLHQELGLLLLPHTLLLLLIPLHLQDMHQASQLLAIQLLAIQHQHHLHQQLFQQDLQLHLLQLDSPVQDSLPLCQPLLSLNLHTIITITAATSRNPPTGERTTTTLLTLTTTHTISQVDQTSES
jgi:hypothetical protein